MKLEDILQRVTLAPAKQLGQVRELATLEPGTVSDIAIFKLSQQAVSFKDRDGAERWGEQVLLPHMTIKNGTIIWAQTGFH